MKAWISALLACLLALGPVTAFGLEADKLVTEAYFYTGNLYYCDAPRNKVVLKNVKPAGIINEQSARTAAEAEYNEIWISGQGTLAGGGAVPLEELNRYADSNVQVIIIRSAWEGIRVVAVKFL